MSNQLVAKNNLFTPRDLVSTPIEGKTYLKLYPKRNIGDTWSELENNLAFNVNASTLENSTLKKNVITSCTCGIILRMDGMGCCTKYILFLKRYWVLGYIE